jgi:polyphosphate kinase
MSPTEALVSIGDDGVLNQTLSSDLSEIWIDRDLSWLDFNDPALKAKLWELLGVNLRDRRLAWVMKSDGSYELLQPADGDGPEAVGTHEVLMNLALARASA